MNFLRPEELPEDCKTCPDLLERAKYFASVQYIGKIYYIPITPHTAKILGLITTRLPTKEECPFSKEQSIDKFFQDQIAALYLQVRDTIGSEIYQNLSTEIKKGFEGFFEKNLDIAIINKLDQKLLPDKKVETELKNTEKSNKSIPDWDTVEKEVFGNNNFSGMSLSELANHAGGAEVYRYIVKYLKKNNLFI
jgi:hypothetical protein